MTTLSQITARIEAEAAAQAAKAEAIREAEKADLENAYARLAGLRKTLETSLGTQLDLLRTVMAGGEALRGPLEEIELTADLTLTIDEVEDLIADAVAGLGEFAEITRTMKSGDYKTYSNVCVCGMCGTDEENVDYFDGDEGDTAAEAPLDPEALGAALQNAIANGTLTPDGGPQQLTVGGRTVNVMPLGVAENPSDLADILGKLGASVVN